MYQVVYEEEKKTRVKIPAWMIGKKHTRFLIEQVKNPGTIMKYVKQSDDVKSIVETFVAFPGFGLEPEKVKPYIVSKPLPAAKVKVGKGEVIVTIEDKTYRLYSSRSIGAGVIITPNPGPRAGIVLTHAIAASGVAAILYNILREDYRRVAEAMDDSLRVLDASVRFSVAASIAIALIEQGRVYTMVPKETGDVVEVEVPSLSPEEKALINKVRDFVNRLAAATGNTEYAELLVFGLVASMDTRLPPVNVHAVGEPGTLKTLGPVVLAKHVKNPVLLVTVPPGEKDQKRAYNRLLEIVADTLKLPVEALDHRAGGVIRSVECCPLRATISILHVESLAPHKTPDLVAELKREGFDVETVYEPLSVRILDTAQVQNIDEYRYRYKPMQDIGVVQESDVFSSHIVVVDEGSRNPRALEQMLTKMSVTDVNETVRLIIVTDNVDTFTTKLASDTMAPFHDRVYRVFTAPPPTEFTPVLDIGVEVTTTELHHLNRLMRKIYVPPALNNIMDVLVFSIGYVFVKVKPGGEFIIAPVHRGTVNDEIAIDPLGLRDVYVAAGWRIRHQVIELAKFYALTSGRTHVTLDDVSKAVRIVVRSRIVPKTATPWAYRARVTEASAKVSDLVLAADRLVAKIDEAYKAITSDTSLLKKLVEEVDTNPIIAPILSTAALKALSAGVVAEGKIARYIAAAVAIAVGRDPYRLGLGQEAVEVADEIEKLASGEL